jgi:hypothetical protein
LSEKKLISATIQKKDLNFKKVIDRIHFSVIPKTMCLVSKEIKFCTCEEESTSELPHYWKFYRFNKDKDLRIVGKVMMPKENLDPSFALNKNTIRNRLNS